jgi:hypothetical protein
MNRLAFGLIGALICGHAMAAGDFRCLRSAGPGNPIRLQFDIESDHAGSVTYQKGSGPIPIKLLKEQERTRGPNGRPSEFAATWQEMTPDGPGGTYVVVSQGALISQFRYVRKSDGRSISFQDDPDSVTDEGCTWNIR